MTKLKYFQEDYVERKGRFKSLNLSLAQKQAEEMSLASKLLDIEEAKMVVQLLAKQNQDKLVGVLNSAVTSGLQSVFGDVYAFKMVIETNAGAIQAYPVLSKNGFEYNPKASEAGGILQMVSLALRISLLSLTKQPTPIVVLDEMLKDVGKKDLGNACKMLRMFSQTMQLQFILTTHAREIIDVSDALYYVFLDKDVNSCARSVSKEEAVDIFIEMAESNKEETLQSESVK